MARPKKKRATTKPLRDDHLSDDEPQIGNSDESAKSQSQSQTTQAEMALIREKIEQSKQKATQVRLKGEVKVEETKKRRIQEIQGKMHDCRQRHETHIRTLRRPKIERLRRLLDQKRILEGRLQDCYAEIDKNWEATLEQYRMVAQGRLQDLTDQLQEPVAEHH